LTTAGYTKLISTEELELRAEELEDESLLFLRYSNAINNKKVRAQAETQCMRICTYFSRGILHALGQQWRVDTVAALIIQL
jgi:predicted S18 family serine protease